jgi:hypothetical protein
MVVSLLLRWCDSRFPVLPVIGRKEGDGMCMVAC